MPLPPGLFLNRATGAITGTPSQAGTFTFTLRVRDAQNQLRDIPSTIEILPYTAPSLSGSMSLFAMRTQAYSSQFTLSDGTGPFAWSIASGTLPTGLSINAATGAVTGTPTDTTYTSRALTVRVVDSLGGVAQRSITLRYANLLAYPSSYPAAFLGSAYDHTPVAVGGHAPLTFAVAGTLPPGLSFSTSTGRLFGTPTTTGSYPVTMTVTDAAGNTSQITPTLAVSPAYVAVDVTGSVSGTSSTIEKASGSHTFSPSYGGVSVSGGTGGYTYSWARISGSTAISASSANVLDTGFTGTVAPGASASATFRLTVSDGSTSDTLDATITITNNYVFPSLTGAPSEYAMRGAAYSSGYGVSGGKSPFSWAVTSGTLPTGLSISSSTGVISGTPTDTSYVNRNLTIRATDSEGQSASASFTLQYFDALALGGTAPAGSQGQPYTFTPTRTGGFPAFTYAVISGTLPAGLSLNASTGTVSGTPSATTAGTAVTIRVTDSQLYVADVALNFVVNAYTPVDLSGSVSGQSDTVESYAGSKTINPNYSLLATNGGLGTITYSWAKISGSTAISASSPSAKETAFTATAAPGATASALFRLTATDGTSSDTFDVTVELTNTYVEPSLSGTLAARSTRTVAYSSGLTRSGGKAPFTWAVVSGTLPTGLTINSGTGVISGTPTDASFTTRNITVAVTDSEGRSATSAQTITYRDVPNMVAATLPYGWRNVPYSGSVVAANAADTHALTYAYVSGDPIFGLTLDTNTGAITGTPTSTNYASIGYTYRATDIDGNFDEAVFTLPYADNLAASESTPNVASGASYSGSVSRTGGHSPFTYAVQSGALPSGITLNGTTGIISGSSTVVGSYSGNFRVTDVGGRTADVAFALDVQSALSVSKSFAGGTEGSAYSGSVTASGGTGPYTYAVQSGALPPGLSLNASTGAVTGTPTTPGAFNFVIRATDSASATADTTSTQVVIANSVNLIDANHGVFGFAPSTAAIEITSSGAINKVGGGGGSVGTWLLSGAAGDFELRATLISTVDVGTGQSTIGTYGTWLSLSATRTFGADVANASSSREISVLLEIRRAGGSGVVLDSSSHTITAETSA